MYTLLYFTCVVHSDLDPIMKITKGTALLIKIDTCLIQARKVKSATGQIVARYNVLHKSVTMLCYYGIHNRISVVKHTIIKLLA